MARAWFPIVVEELTFWNEIASQQTQNTTSMATKRKLGRPPLTADQKLLSAQKTRVCGIVRKRLKKKTIEEALYTPIRCNQTNTDFTREQVESFTRKFRQKLDRITNDQLVSGGVLTSNLAWIDPLSPFIIVGSG